jgi:hypothetical protein
VDAIVTVTYDVTNTAKVVISLDSDWWESVQNDINAVTEVEKDICATIKENWADADSEITDCSIEFVATG